MSYPNTNGVFIKSRFWRSSRFITGCLVLACCWMLILVGQVQAQEQNAQDSKPSFLSPDTFQVAKGFKAELVFEVTKEYGSWVSMTTSPMGLITSDQYGKLYVVEPGDTADETSVTPIPVELGHAQGLLWAFDSLYVMAHPMKGVPGGLYRVTDSDADGQLDQISLLRKIEGGGEHGPHAIILSPDGKSLYICAGNHTKLTDVQSSQVPRNWQEDNLLKRMWDPGGHAVGKMAPGGWVCKTDPEGKHWELISIGYRNQYDIAFDSNGELFTYDADMEWDIGTPWYRPTRVCHVTAGSEFGWRGGDAKWPVYYPDSLPPVIEIGPGSPTGIVFGTGADFPEKYQQALFIADWSFGFIYAIHMKPDGGSWTGEKELFCSAPTMQVTDMVVHDGDLYFSIGGRRTQSAVYRVSAELDGNEPAGQPDLTEAQMARREIEASDPNLKTAWPLLRHKDRWVRYAARMHLERLPLSDWLERVDAESDSQAILESALAVARHTDRNARTTASIVEKLRNLDWAELNEQQQLSLLRVLGLCLVRERDEATRKTIIETCDNWLSPMFPSDSILLNRELCRLLVACNGESVIEKTLNLVDDASTQEEQIHYVMCLRTVPAEEWDASKRSRYLEWFVKSAVFQGGKSFTGYLTNARAEFVAELSDEQRKPLAHLIDVELKEQNPYAELNAREVVKKWAVSDLLPAIESANWKARDLENGRRVFTMAQCYKCHQFAGNGGIVGPDLTGLSRRYTNQYLLETIIDPHKEISSQYQATLFELDNGRMVTGRVANLVNDTFMVQEDMISPGKLTNIKRDSIVESKPSKISPMPANLLDSFAEDEILDLFAYLRSASPETGGNR